MITLIIGMGSASSAAVGPLLAVGAAMLGMGAGIYLAAAGLALVVEAFTKLGNTSKIVVESFGMFLDILKNNITTLFSAGVGLGAVGVGLMSLSAGILAVGTSGMVSGIGLAIVTTGMLALGEAVDMIGNGLMNSSKGIYQLISSFKRIPSVLPNLISLTSQLDKLDDNINSINLSNISIAPKLDNVKYNDKQITDNSNSELIKKIDELIAINKTNKNIGLKVFLDGKELRNNIVMNTPTNKQIIS